MPPGKIDVLLGKIHEMKEDTHTTLHLKKIDKLQILINDKMIFPGERKKLYSDFAKFSLNFYKMSCNVSEIVNWTTGFFFQGKKIVIDKILSEIQITINLLNITIMLVP